MGGICARVCPVETLCEEACVRNLAEDKPVKIGELQRYATDHLMERGEHPFRRAAPTGKRIAVVGAGPGRARLRASPRAARPRRRRSSTRGKSRAASTNTASPPTRRSNEFAQREVDFILAIGGITIENGKALGRDFSLADLKGDFDAVFLGMGLAGVNALGADGESAKGSEDAVAWIAELRQASDRRRAAGRPPRRRHRRRHDGDRRRRAVEASRRGGGDDRLSPRPGRHEGEPLGAGAGADAAA